MVPPRVRVALSLLGALVCIQAAADSPLWGTIRVPGTAAAARRVMRLDVSPGRTNASLALELARLAHGNNTNERTVEQIDRYFKTIDEFQTARRALPNGLSVPTQGTPKKDRDATERVTAWLGLKVRSRAHTFFLEPDTSESAVERARWMAANGLDPARLVAATATGAPVALDVTDSEVPLPLPGFWQEEVFQPRSLPILDILKNRAASLLYVGLLSLDEETLAFLDAHRPFVRRLRDERAPAFSTFGRSIRIHGGSVDVPGGRAAVPVWEALVGRSPADAERFMSDLLGQDEGRLAYFYDTVDHLDASRQAFALSASLDGATRARAVRRTYDHFALTPEWKLADRPSYRPAFDAAVALAFVDVRPDGALGPPLLPWLLEEAAAGGAWPAAADVAPPEGKSRAADAEWLLGWVFESPKDAVARYRLFRFAQRQLATVDTANLAKASQALRAAYEMPALIRALERLHVTDLATFADMGAAAHRITESGGSGDAGPVLMRWQAALALLEQANRHHRLAPATTTRLLASLTALVPKRHEDAEGVFAAWLADTLVPALVPDASDAPDLERALVGAMAGLPGQQGFTFSWEGLDYVVDTAGAVTRQVTAIRQSQRTPRAQDLVALYRARRQIERGVSSLEALQSLVSGMTGLKPAVALLRQPDGSPDDAVDKYGKILSELGGIKKAQDLKRVSRVLPETLSVIDTMTDAVLEPLAYALASTPTDQPAPIVAAAWRAHTFGTRSAADQRPWSAVAWQTAAPIDDGVSRGLRLTGSYLNLDIALAASRLVEGPADPALDVRIGGEDRAALIQTTQLQLVSEPDGLDAAIASVQDGRQLLTQWSRSVIDGREVRPRLAAAGVDETRANLITWIAERRPQEAFASLQTTEVLRLAPSVVMPPAFAWAAPDFDGCFCFLRPEGRALEEVRGRVGLQARAVAAEALARIAEGLADMRLPPRLAPAVLSAMAPDWLGHIRQVADYDWESLAMWPGRVSHAQIEDALLHLVSSGILSSPRGGETPRRP